MDFSFANSGGLQSKDDAPGTRQEQPTDGRQPTNNNQSQCIAVPTFRHVSRRCRAVLPDLLWGCLNVPTPCRCNKQSSRGLQCRTCFNFKNGRQISVRVHNHLQQATNHTRVCMLLTKSPRRRPSLCMHLVYRFPGSLPVHG